MEEIKQSLRIIDQCLHQMPDGPVIAKLPRLLRPRPAGLRRRREPARPVRHATSSATAPTSRSGCGSTTRRTSTAGVGAADEGQPHRRHHGHHGFRLDQSWRGRQVIAGSAKVSARRRRGVQQRQPARQRRNRPCSGAPPSPQVTSGAARLEDVEPADMAREGRLHGRPAARGPDDRRRLRHRAGRRNRSSTSSSRTWRSRGLSWRRR